MHSSIALISVAGLSLIYTTIILVVVLLTVVVILAIIARWVKISYPILLVFGGLLLALRPRPGYLALNSHKQCKQNILQRYFAYKFFKEALQNLYTSLIHFSFSLTIL